MIYWQLFLTFFEIGAVSFGGGYGMLSLIRERTLAMGWLSEGELLNLIAISESTPGPIAVNMATFVGSGQAGFLGAAVATLGVVLPAFLVTLLIAAVIRNLLKYAGVQAFLGGVRPCVVALIMGTAVTMLLSNLLGIKTVESAFAPDGKGIVIFVLLAAGAMGYKRLRHRAISPLLLILVSGVLGLLLYGVGA